MLRHDHAFKEYTMCCDFVVSNFMAQSTGLCVFMDVSVCVCVSVSLCVCVHMYSP